MIQSKSKQKNIKEIKLNNKEKDYKNYKGRENKRLKFKQLEDNSKEEYKKINYLIGMLDLKLKDNL